MKTQIGLDSHYNCAHPADKVHLHDSKQVKDHVEAVDWGPGEEEDDADPNQNAKYEDDENDDDYQYHDEENDNHEIHEKNG